MAEERILIVQLRQLGDILLTTPCLSALRKAKPKARLTFLSHKMGHLIIDGCPYVDEHFSYGSDWTWRQEWRLAETLRQRRFDLVIDFMNNPRSAFYTLMSGGKDRVAFASARRPAYTKIVPRPEDRAYVVRHKFRLLEAAGVAASDVRPVLPWSEAHTQPMMRFLGTEPRFREAPLRVALSPTHRREVRRWPLPRYAALADRLAREWDAAVVWLWGPGEEAEIDAVRALCREPTLKAPPTGFREMAALLANCDLFIGNSNGPSHVAVAVDIPSLQLHGHTDAVSWCPLTERHRAVQSPEFGKVKMPSMAAIGEAVVWDELVGLKAVVEAQARQRRKGPRLTWRQ